MGRLRGRAGHQGYRQERHRCLDGELGRTAAGPAHVHAGKRVHAPLEPGRQVPRLRVVTAGGEGRANLADEPRRRRGNQGERREGGRGRLRLVPRRQADCPRRQRAGPVRPRTREGQEGRRQEDAEADRHRSVLLQGGRRGLPAQREVPPLPVRRGHEEGRGADARRVQRGVPGLVARRPADRLHPAARRRGCGQGPEQGRLRHRRTHWRRSRGV